MYNINRMIVSGESEMCCLGLVQGLGGPSQLEGTVWGIQYDLLFRVEGLGCYQRSLMVMM